MNGASLLGCLSNRNPGTSGSQQAYELAYVTSGSGGGNFSVVVARYGANTPDNNGTPRFKLSFLTNGSGAVTGTEYSLPTGTDVLGPTIFGHNGTSGAVSTAASDVRVTPSTVTSYSSHGPVTLLFGPVTGTTPAAPLATPQVLAKPDLTASDCGINTYFGFTDGTHYRFCGTSAAAPHAAAVAALLLQQNPGLTPDQINAALTSTAVGLGSLSPRTQGAGLVDAAAAGAAVVPQAQTISFAQPASGAVGGARLPSATSSSGLPVTFSVDAATSPVGACTVSGPGGGTVHYAKAGSCVIDANQAGNALYLPAPTAKKTIAVKPAPAVTTKTLASGVVGKKYASGVHSTGGNAPVRWAVTAGKLPAGLTLTRSGAISGKPTKAGTFQVTISVSDSSAPSVTAAKHFAIKIAPIAVRTTALRKGIVGKKYSARLKAYGGSAPRQWKITAGSLPSGLSLAKSGAISGRPTKAGKYHLTVRVTDSAGHKATRKLVLTVAKH